MKCPLCHRNFEGPPDIPLNYCPACGTKFDETPQVTVNTNMFDICHTYTNCTVQVLENSQTGTCSVGWMRTAETEEIE